MKKIALLAFPLALIVAACGGGGGAGLADSGGLPQAARVDRAAACSYAHVWVTVTAVRALRDDGSTQAWQDIALNAPARIDLLSAGGGVLQALGAAPLDAGHYTQVRLLLVADGNTVQPAGGAEAALKVPGGAASGLKLMGDITVATNAKGDVALDAFDPCTAIVVTGNGSYNLKPEAQASMKPVMQAGPEVVGAAGEALPVPGGGYALAAHGNWGTPWTLQRYDASGQPVGASFTVTTGEDIAGHFAALAGGGYAAVWLNSATTVDVNQVMTQAWDAAGHALSAPTPVALVHPGGNGPPVLPQIAALPDGNYVIAWGQTPGNTDVYAQRYTSSGAAAAPPVLVTTSGRGSLGLTALASGGYLVAWGQFAPATTGGVRAYSASDVPLGPVQNAGSSGEGGGPPMPVLRGLAGGGAVIAWQAVHEHLMMQQVGPDGTPLAPAQVVDDQTASPVYGYIAIGALPDGGSVIAWIDAGTGNVYARRYLASGAPAGPQTQVNIATTQASVPVSVDVLADGSFQIRWTAAGADGTRAPYVRTFPADALRG